MTKITLDQIKKLRQQTKAGVMDCRRALEESGGNLEKAQEWLREKGINSATKRVQKETGCGLVEAYTHSDGRIVAVVELRSETDFVARTEEFRKLAHELAMQVAAMNPKDVKELLKQPWIRDEKKTVEELVKETGGKLGENIMVKRIARFELGNPE
jgi:elongation factor Ts